MFGENECGMLETKREGEREERTLDIPIYEKKDVALRCSSIKNDKRTDASKERKRNKYGMLSLAKIA